MTNVVSLPGADSKPLRDAPRDLLDPAAVLAGAVEKQGGIEAVLVLGLNHDGSLFAASSSPHTADVLLLMERVRQKLMRQFDGDEFGGDAA